MKIALKIKNLTVLLYAVIKPKIVILDISPTAGKGGEK